MSYRIDELTISPRLARIPRKLPVERFLIALKIRSNSTTEAHIRKVYPLVSFASGRAKLLEGLKLILIGVRSKDVVKRVKDPNILTMNQAKLLILSRILGRMDKAMLVMQELEAASWKAEDAEGLLSPRKFAIFDALIFGTGAQKWKNELWEQFQKMPVDFSGLEVTLPGLLKEYGIQYPGASDGLLQFQEKFLELHLPDWRKILLLGGHNLVPNNLSRLVSLALDKLRSNTPEERVEGALWLTMCDLKGTLLEQVLRDLGHKLENIRNKMGRVLIEDGLGNDEQSKFVGAFSDLLILPGSDQADEKPLEEDELIF